MKIYVIRHGETDWPDWNEQTENCDPGLTADGREEIKMLARNLKDVGIKHILCSPRLRTKESAGCFEKELEKITGKKIFSTILLPQLTSVGLPTGENLKKILGGLKKEIPWFELWIKDELRPEGMEPPSDFILRTDNVIKLIQGYSLPNEVITVVAHEETVWAFNHVINNISFEEAARKKVATASAHTFII